MKKYITLFFFVLLFLAFGVKAQDAANYTFSTNATGSLTGGAGWTTIIGAGQNNTTFDDGFGNVPLASVVNLPPGFDLWFMGERFTSFTVNANGVLRFGTVPIVSQGNTYNIDFNARLCPFGASSATGVLDEGDWQTGEVRYKILDTGVNAAPNRVLIVQCNNMRISNDSGTSDSNFEMQVQETSRPTVSPASGQVTFVYGGMRKGTAGDITSGNIGIGYVDFIGGNDFLSVNIATHTASTTATNNTYPNGTITQLNSAANGSRRRYIFNPVAVVGQEVDVKASCLSSSSFILNWTDNATNEVGIVLYRSTDGGATFTFDRQLPANTSSATITGLNPSTTYHYQVYAVTEGKLSILHPTSGTVIVSTLSAAVNAVYSITNGLWNTAATWTPTGVPVATNDVIIGCIVPHTVTVNAPAVSNVCKTLLVETGSVLNFNAGQTLTVQGDVTNKGTINTNGGTLIIQGNLINTTGATVNVGTGSITVQGNLTNNATATVNINSGTLRVQGNLQNNATATLNGNTGLFRLGGNFINPGIYNSATSTMRFDGTAQQLINHTGTSSGQGINTVSNSYNNNTVLTTAAATNTYTNTTDITISDNSSVSRIITVPTTLGLISDITVDLDIDHNYVGDLIVTLTSPSGTIRTLINRPRRTGVVGSCNRSNIRATLSDAAAAGAANNVQTRCVNGNINGTYRPFETLAVFDGENPSGEWILTISDNANGDTGIFRNVNLNIATNAAAGIAIPDNNIVGGLNHTINVPTAGTIQSVTMSIGINHTFIGNLIVTLTNPGGTTTRTMLTRVANGTGTCDGDNLSITFDDLAAASVQSQCDAGVPSINGTFQPNQNLAAFVGQSQLGNWTVNVSDVAGGQIGGLMSASLHITTLQPVAFPLSANLYFHNVQMQNTGSEVRTQNTDINILNTATWTTGVFRADNNHKLIFVDNATSTIGNNASHADMQVRKIGNDAFNFPVGNGGWVAQIGITAPANITDHFTAQYFKQVTPFNPFLKEASIHHVGQCEYWILDRTNGASNVQVTLSYDDIRSCTVGPTTGLKVVRWDGAIWRDHFNGGLIAAPYNGVLSLGTVNNFSPFTLGAETDLNILPLTFLSFDAKPFESDAILDWTTTGELNHDYFEVERSINEQNGQDFKSIGKVKNPISRDNTKSIYSFIDKNVGIENTEAYYRLKQIDTDGKFSYSDIKKVNWSIDNSQNGGLFIAYPNPFSDILTLDFSLDRQEMVEITLLDMTGRTIKTISQSFSKGSQKIEFNNLQNLAQGSYLIQLRTSTLQKTFKIVKM